MKKVFLVFLLLLCLAFAVSCGESDGAPQGMKLAVPAEDVGYTLYVPSAWTVVRERNAVYAYVSPVDISGIVFTRTPSGGQTPKEFRLADRAHFAALDSFEELNTDDALPVTGVNSSLAEYRYSVDGETYRVECVYIPNADFMYILTYTEKTDGVFSENEEAVSKILENLSFDGENAPYAPITPFPDENAPAETVRASNPKIAAYALYIPAGWTIEAADESTLVTAHDASTVNCFITVPSEAELSDYIDDYTQRVRVFYSDFSLLSRGDVTFGANYPATELVYTGNYLGVAYKVRQIFLKSGYYVFSFTYTSRAENYDSHLSDVDKMLSDFRFGQ